MVNGSYYCGFNKLRSLKGAPLRIKGDFSCQGNLIDDIGELPTHVNGYLNIENNKFTSLRGIDKHVKYIHEYIYISGNPIIGGIMGLMRIKGLQYVIANPNTSSPRLVSACLIISKYLGAGNRGIISAQAELIDHELDEFAEF
jgi:hypothetical protein